MEWFKMNDGAQGEVRLQLCFLELNQNRLHHGQGFGHFLGKNRCRTYVHLKT